MLLLQKINNISNLPLLPPDTSTVPVVENVVWHSHLISNLFVCTVHTFQNGSRGFIHKKSKDGNKDGKASTVMK